MKTKFLLICSVLVIGWSAAAQPFTNLSTAVCKQVLLSIPNETQESLWKWVQANNAAWTNRVQGWAYTLTTNTLYDETGTNVVGSEVVTNVLHPRTTLAAKTAELLARQKVNLIWRWDLDQERAQCVLLSAGLFLATNSVVLAQTNAYAP